MRLHLKGLQSAKDAVTGGGTSSSSGKSDEEEAFLEVESDRVERAINFLIGQETSVPHAELRTVLHGLARDNAVLKSAIMAHGTFVEKQHVHYRILGGPKESAIAMLDGQVPRRLFRRRIQGARGRHTQWPQ